MTLPAFQVFFLGEHFAYVRQYRAQGSFWRAVFSPGSEIFFRPVLTAASLFWHSILPPDPFLFHLRNFAFIAINLFLLYRVLLRLVENRFVRVLALSLFVVSKVHFTTIGYINIYDALLMLTLLLLTILLLLRFLSTGRRLDYLGGLLFCGLSIFSKDYGIAVIAPVGYLLSVRAFSKQGQKRLWTWTALMLPVVGMAMIYLLIRYSIVGGLPDSNPIYTPQLSLENSARKMLILASGIWNLSFINRAATGESGFTPAMVQHLGLSSRFNYLDWGLLLACSALFAITLILARREWHRWVLPIIWAVAYYSPTFLIRNLQVYYIQESLAALAVLVGVCLDRAPRRLMICWSIAIVMAGVNGVFSNYRSSYFWQDGASVAQRVYSDLLEARTEQRLDRVTIVTSRVPLVSWALIDPFLQELLMRPDLRVRVVDRQSAEAAAIDQRSYVVQLE
jgi:hypothetical protein